MARYRYVVLGRAKQGREEEYKGWYRDQHLPDVRRQPGVVAADLFELLLQKDYDLDAPEYATMAVYELECADPAATIEAIKAQAGSAGMPMTGSLDKSGMLQLVGRLIGSA